MIDDPATAAARAGEILAFAPGQPHALALLVASLRLTGGLSNVRDILSRMATAEPNLASIQYELGNICIELKDGDGAIAALSRATEMEPAHAAAWRLLGDQLSQNGNKDAAGQCYARHFDLQREQIQSLDPAKRPKADQLKDAERDLRLWLARCSTDVASLRMLGATLLRLGAPAEAERALEQAVELSPRFSVARWLLARVLAQRSAWPETLAHLEILLQQEPSNSDYLNLKADALTGLRRFKDAIATYGHLLSVHSTPENWMYYAHALKSVGRREDSVEAYRNAIGLRPNFGQAYWGLANMKTFRFTDSETDGMRRALQTSEMGVNDRTQMYFALGKALEDAQDYAASFQNYQSGNALWRRHQPHDAEDMSAMVRRQKSVFNAEFYAQRAGAGSPASGPIFIVGLPRSGSSLIEQILASHSMVEGIGELAALNSVAQQLADRQRTVGDDYPENLRFRSADEMRRAGEEYIARTKPYRELERERFIDKMPGNFHHLGLLLLILPNARVIDARRHPLATGFANFKQFYPQAQSFAFDLREIGRYYNDYVELMAHFDSVLPGRVHRVFYETLVGDLETEVRRLLAYCGLPFEESCLRFHETDRGVATASSEQVRRKIYTDSLEQWQHYEPWLDPLKETLGEVLKSYPRVPPFAAAPRVFNASPGYTIQWTYPAR